MALVSSVSITPDMTVGEIVDQYPQVIDLLSAAGLHCVGCHASPHETLAEGMYGHGKSDADVIALVHSLNSYLAEQEQRPVLTLTENAASFLQKSFTVEGKVGWGLFVAVSPGGCSGFRYVLDFKEKAEDSDVLLQQHGVSLFVDKESLPYLRGLELDYVSMLQQSGFKFSNPNAKHSCGCGSSVGF